MYKGEDYVDCRCILKQVLGYKYFLTSRVHALDNIAMLSFWAAI